jgi:hypothetical protein
LGPAGRSHEYGPPVEPAGDVAGEESPPVVVDVEIVDVADVAISRADVGAREIASMAQHGLRPPGIEDVARP